MDAFEACAKVGFGWYLPGIEELKAMAAVVPEVNQGVYWSSTEDNTDTACCLNRGVELKLPKKNQSGVIAVRRFRYDGTAVASAGTLYEQENGVAREYKILASTHEYGTVKQSSFTRLIRFTEKTILSGIHLFKGLLFFHDRLVNEPYKLNIQRARDLNYYQSEDAMKVVKRPPDMPTIEARSVEGSAENFRYGAYQFAARYEYEDGEMSAISPYSGMAFNLIARTKEDQKDFTSVNMVKVAINPVTNKKELVKVYSEDGNTFSETTIRLKSNFSGEYMDIYQNSNMVCGCSAAREKDLVVGAVGGRGFILSDENYYLVNGISLTITGGCTNHDGSNVLYSGVGDNYMWIYQLDRSGKYPQLKGIKGFENGAYDSYGKVSVEREYMTHMLAMNSDGNLCYALSKDTLWWSQNGGSTEDGWLKLAGLTDIFKSTGESEWKPLMHVCCSSNGRVIYVATPARVGVSRDGGSTWSAYEIGFKRTQGIHGICCSADGKRVIISSGYWIRISNNFGATFEIAQGIPEGNSAYYDPHMYGVGCSDSGDIVFTTKSKDYGQKGNGNIGNEWEVMNYYIFKSVNGGISFKNIPVDCLFPTDIFFSKPKELSENLSDNHITNRTTEVTIRYNTGDRHVKAIHLLMKNGANMYKIHQIEKAGLPDQAIQEYVFRNQGLYPQVAQKDVVKLYDNVPLRVRTSKVIQNALMYGGYVDGHDSAVKVDATIEIANLAGGRGSFSLKCNTIQTYGMVYYDAFGRCGPVQLLGDIYTNKVTRYPNAPQRVARITLRHQAPDWAVKYKFVRKSMAIRFDGINGFNGAFVYKGKIYLDITSHSDIVPSVGDMLELVYEPKGNEPGRLGTEFQVLGYEDIISSDNAEEITLPRGRYMVIDEPGLDGYNKADVTSKTSDYLSSYFYLVYHEKVDDGKVYQETPFEFTVLNRLHQGNVKNQDKGGEAVCRLDGDGDVIMLDNPTREINRLLGGAIFTTLGRTNAIVDNFKETDRQAGLCVSEPYVEDTGYNGLSSFNLSLVNYKDLDDGHGEVELIDGYGTDVDVYQRERCSQVQYRKNILATASGDSQVAQSQDIFGEQLMYGGDWGMSDFRSYARWGNARYFVDAKRGVVLRKEAGSLAPVSDWGMKDWFFDRLRAGSEFMGCFDPRHGAYLLALGDGIINFLEAAKGWSSFFTIQPDKMVNTPRGVYSFKEGKLYRHDARENECRLYGQNADVVVEVVCNEWADVVKVFNALLLETTDKPYRVEFRSGEQETVIDGSYFEKQETLYLSCIPMGSGEGEYVLAGVCAQPYAGSIIPLASQDSTAVHVGDKVYVMHVGEDGTQGEQVYVGQVQEVGNGYLQLDKQVDVKAGSFILCADASQINGEPQRGRHLGIKMYFRPQGKLLVRSIQVDVDESRI